MKRLLWILCLGLLGACPPTGSDDDDATSDDDDSANDDDDATGDDDDSVACTASMPPYTL